MQRKESCGLQLGRDIKKINLKIVAAPLSYHRDRQCNGRESYEKKISKEIRSCEPPFLIQISLICSFRDMVPVGNVAKSRIHLHSFIKLFDVIVQDHYLIDRSGNLQIRLHREKYMFVMTISGPDGNYFPIDNKRIL